MTRRGPNPQNIPIRTEEGRRILEAFRNRDKFLDYCKVYSTPPDGSVCGVPYRTFTETEMQAMHERFGRDLENSVFFVNSGRLSVTTLRTDDDTKEKKS